MEAQKQQLPINISLKDMKSGEAQTIGNNERTYIVVRVPMEENEERSYYKYPNTDKTIEAVGNELDSMIDIINDAHEDKVTDHANDNRV